MTGVWGKMFGSRNALKSDFAEVIDIVLSGAFDLVKLVTGVYDYDKAAQAFDDFDKNGARHFKMMLKF